MPKMESILGMVFDRKRRENFNDGSQLIFSHIFMKPTKLTGFIKLGLWVDAESSDDMDLFVGVSKFDSNSKAFWYFSESVVVC
jgi:hypothetical protein